MKCASARLLFGALGLAAPTALSNLSSCEQTCDPANAVLLGDCPAEDETCDAETRVCEEQAACTTHEDCPGGYVCYDSGRCARNCSAGLMVFWRYCKLGYVCDDEYRCAKPPQWVSDACGRSCENLGAACVHPDAAAPEAIAMCVGHCVDRWGELGADECVSAAVLDHFFKCVLDGAGMGKPAACGPVAEAAWENGSASWTPPSGCAQPFTSTSFGVEVSEDGTCTRFGQPQPGR